MSENIVIGKYVLESITTGMYVNPYVVYREYIQNATDAIDEAIHQGLIEKRHINIRISVDPFSRRITIEDNGTGIPHEAAFQTLSNIGTSNKLYTLNRGFRGIGRLSGLSYCDRLTFETSVAGDSRAYKIQYDAQRLRCIMAQLDDRSESADEALMKVISEQIVSSKPSSHYFRVTMEGVAPDSGLLDYEKVHSFLRQTAPVAYNNTCFSWGRIIEQEVCSKLSEIATYEIMLNTPSDALEVLKPYTDQLIISRSTGIVDQIKDVSFDTITSIEGQICGVVWYSISEFLGSIVDRDVKGLRIRVGNILLGDGQTLNHIFKDSRFNGWVTGEVYIYGGGLIPNARRDDFEHNAAYYHLEEQLRSVSAKIAQQIRSASVSRNKALSTTISNIDMIHSKADVVFAGTCVSPSKKGSIMTQINGARKALGNVETNESDQYIKQDAFEQLDILTGRLKGTTAYKAINLISGLTHSEKRLLERIFTSLNRRYEPDKVEKCIDMILSTFDSSNDSLEDIFSMCRAPSNEKE